MRVFAAFVFLLSALYAQQTVTIGVLAHRGEAATLLAWQPTADYLSEQIDNHRFEIVPLPFEGFDPALSQKAVDFIVLNSAFYIEMEYRHGVSRIATLQNRDARGESHTRFGSVIFVRHDSPTTRISQLKEHRLAAVDPISLGGWLMALRQMRHAGIDEGACEVAFEGTHDQVVYRVLAGQADAGVVRSDTLERMAEAGLIKLSDLRVLEPKSFMGFSFLTSTDLYPEWPFARARHTPTALAEKVAIALIRMPSDHPAAYASQISGWTIPLDYQPVHDLMRDLEMGPYSDLAAPTVTQLLKRYWPGVLLALITLFSLTYATLVRGRINRILSERVAEKTRALQHSQDEIASIAESMGEGLLAFDPDGALLLANPAAENILSLGPGAIQSHLKHATFVFNEIRTHLQNGQKGRYSGIWKHGEHARHLSLTIAPLSGPWGDQSGVVVVFGDTTEEHAAKERLEQLNRTLEAKVSEKIAEIRHKERLLSEQGKLVAMAEMMSAIAHHWRQPINNVAVLSQDLQEADRFGELDSGYLDEGVASIMKELRGLSDTIDRFGSFFLPDSHAEAFPPKAAIEETVALLKDQLRQMQIALHLSITAEGEACRVMGYSGEFRQALLNLLLNAKDAISTRREQGAPSLPGEITITLKVVAQTVTIVVCDNGTGVSADVRDRLFDPYFTTKRRAEGVGIGLYMVKMLIEKSMHGRVDLLPTEEAGACFEIGLPLAGGEK